MASICDKLRKLERMVDELYDWALGNPKAWETVHALNPKIWDLLLEHHTLLSIIEDLCGG
jgi:hypothetical protein